MPHPSRPSQSRNFLGKPAEVRQRERRLRLVEAGIRAFGSRGYHAVTVRQICGEAALSERYFYESFENLEQLFGCVYAELNTELKHALLAAAPAKPERPLDLAEAMLRAFLEHIRSDPRRARILLIDAFNIGPDVMRLAGSASVDYASMVARLLERFFGASIARAGLKSSWLARGLVGAQIQIATHWVRERFRTPLEDVLSQLVALYRALIELAQAEAGGRARKQGLATGASGSRVREPRARAHTPPRARARRSAGAKRR